MKKVIRLSSLLVMLFALVALCACAPANTDKAAEKMKKADYTAIVNVFKEEGENGEIANVTGGKNELSLAAVTDSYTATLYKSVKAAKEAYKRTQNAEGETGAKLVGKWVFVGSEGAYKAFK